MRIRLGVDPDIDLDTMGEAIDAALEASTVSQVPLIERGKVPDIRKAINAGKVRWQPEPPGDEHFDDARTVLGRGWGDCDDLAPWLAASLRASGEAPDARAYVYQSGPKRWHAVVDRGDGKVLDPSKWAGMAGHKRGAPSVVGIGAATWAPMWPERLAIAAHPYGHGFAGRVDVPDQGIPLSWSAVSYSPTRAGSVRAAARAAQQVADLAGEPWEEDMARLSGLDYLMAAPDSDEATVAGDVLGQIACVIGEDGVEELIPAAQAFGPNVGSLFGKIFKGIKSVAAPVAKLAAPIVSKGLQFIPGVGPVASTAFDMTREALRSKGGGGAPGPSPVPVAQRLVSTRFRPPPASVTSAQQLRGGGVRSGTAMSLPGGIVIVRF